MSTQYNWTITALDAYPQHEGEADVVFNCHWTASATDGTHNASVYNTQAVTYVAGTPYTPFAQLTQDQVLGWIWSSGVDKDATQSSLDTMIANQINPPVVSPKLPWIS